MHSKYAFYLLRTSTIGQAEAHLHGPRREAGRQLLKQLTSLNAVGGFQFQMQSDLTCIVRREWTKDDGKGDVLTLVKIEATNVGIVVADLEGRNSTVVPLTLVQMPPTFESEEWDDEYVPEPGSQRRTRRAIDVLVETVLKFAASTLAP